MLHIKSPQDLGTALVLVAIGGGGFWFGRELDVGSAAHMGPGYMPMLLSGSIVLFGLVIGLRAVTIAGPAIAPGRWRPVILVLGAILTFAALISTAGLAITTFVTAALGAFASVEARWWEALGLAVFLAALCVLLFVLALNQPIPILWTDQLTQIPLPWAR
jgi:hypothetical protein